MLNKLTSLLTGNMFKEAKDLVLKYIPPDMPEAQRKELEIKLTEITGDKELELQKIVLEANHEFNNRIAEHEGTAKDLKSIPYLGAAMLFIRGAQRPIWNFATLYFDYLWFSNGADFTNQQGTVLLCLNLLVVGFLYGERSIQNIKPTVRMFSELMTVKKDLKNGNL